MSLVNKTPKLIYSLLASYGEARQRALPGSWFVSMLQSVGVSEDAVRKALQRMQREGALTASRRGRERLYALTPLGRASTLTSTERLRRPPLRSWDGSWTLVVYRFDADHRIERDRIKSILTSAGFAPLSRGTFIHPHERLGALREVIEGTDLEHSVRIFRASSVGNQPDETLARSLWDLRTLARMYRDFSRKYGPLAKHKWTRTPGPDVLATRFGVVLDYLEATWEDPELPEAFLPESWPAGRAWEILDTLYRSLNEPLLRYGDEVLQSVQSHAS